MAHAARPDDQQHIRERLLSAGAAAPLGPVLHQRLGAQRQGPALAPRLPEAGQRMRSLLPADALGVDVRYAHERSLAPGPAVKAYTSAADIDPAPGAAA